MSGRCSRRSRRPDGGSRRPLLVTVCAALTSLGLVVLGLGAAPGTSRAATSPAPPTPLPVELLIAPDGDVLGGPGVLVAEGLSAPPRPPATAWLVVDVDTGAVLAAENARARLLPASTLKMLTALALGPHLPPDRQYTSSEAAANIEGSRVGIRAGSVYTVQDLLYGLMLGSGNDTAVALSELVGGDPAAARLMNEKAAALGATDTFAVNTSGLDGPGQVTSARDLALIGSAMIDDARIGPIAATRVFDFPGEGTDVSPERPRYQIANHNRMLAAYPGAIGGKTGFTQAARGTYVSAADRDGRRLMCSMLHSEGLEWQHCASLLDWAYAQPAPTTPVTTLAASVRAAAPPAPEPAPEQAGPPAGEQVATGFPWWGWAGGGALVALALTVLLRAVLSRAARRRA